VAKRWRVQPTFWLVMVAAAWVMIGVLVWNIRHDRPSTGGEASSQGRSRPR